MDNKKSTMNLSDMELYTAAKEAYYAGNPIMSDTEFDELEKELGLENQGYIGTKKNINYSIKHSFIMGSLSKVQIKEDKNHNVDWNSYCNEVLSYLRKSKCSSPLSYYEITPKLDGCSFSVEAKKVNGMPKILHVSTRGDGEYGKDITNWFTLNKDRVNAIYAMVEKECTDDSITLSVRGEILVKRSTFNDKGYSQTFTNPRSFVAGTIGAKWNNDKTFIQQVKDLDFVCYDFRIVDEEGTYTELDWYVGSLSVGHSFYSIYNIFREARMLPENIRAVYAKDFNGEKLSQIYSVYEEYRDEDSEYELDGIVMKPCVSDRLYNTKERPDDCIAIKFMPKMQETSIIGVEWNVGKTGEYFPTGIISPIILDNKVINKVSLHNYHYMRTNNVGVGSTVKISLAGDIVPYIYQVISNENVTELKIPVDSYVEEHENSGKFHLMKIFSERDEMLNKFIASANVLKIPYVGEASATTLFNECYKVFNKYPSNICQFFNMKVLDSVIDSMGRNAKSTQNIYNSILKYKSSITLSDIIESCCFDKCGERAAKLCAKIITKQQYSTSSFPGVAYQWAIYTDNENFRLVRELCSFAGVSMEVSENNEEDTNKIPVILTGDPSKCTSYKTKALWLTAHPSYIETTSWNEAKILFTNDLSSNTSKMQKAAKKGMEIRMYEA